MRFDQIEKRKRNAILARLNSAIDKYGLESVRSVWNRHLQDLRQKERLKKDIEKTEKELKYLQRRMKQ